MEAGVERSMLAFGIEVDSGLRMLEWGLLLEQPEGLALLSALVSEPGVRNNMLEKKVKNQTDVILKKKQ